MIENVFLHSKLLFLVIKKINGASSCSVVVQCVIYEIVEKLSEKKYNVYTSEDDKKELSSNAYQILAYLESQGIIMLTDILKLKNQYKVKFRICQKSEEDLEAEFNQFIETTSSSIKHQHKLVTKQLQSYPGVVRQFFVYLNNSLNINDTLMEISRSDQRHEKSGIRTLVYYLWLFGCLKGYISRLYEVPVPHPVPNPHSLTINISEDAYLQSLKKKHISSAFDYLPFDLCRELLLSLEYNKDEILQRLDIRENTYYDLLREWNINSHIYIEF